MVEGSVVPSCRAVESGYCTRYSFLAGVVGACCLWCGWRRLLEGGVCLLPVVERETMVVESNGGLLLPVLWLKESMPPVTG